MTKTTSTLAKTEDGNIQITFIIPSKEVEVAKQRALSELGKEIEVPGFRKGKAPFDKVEANLPSGKLVEKILSQILPEALGEAIKKYKIKPVIYPKFELVKADTGSDWQIRAITCELPEINLGNYKEAIKGAGQAKQIWTPGKPDSQTSERKPSKEEKEQEILKILSKEIPVNIPKILIEEEVNNRLTNLLSRIEKLGLTLEGYLSSLGKTPEGLRKDYEEQARNTIALELILEKIADSENIKVEESQVDEAINAAGADPSLRARLNTPEQRRLVESVLRRRASLDSLVNLI